MKFYSIKIKAGRSETVELNPRQNMRKKVKMMERGKINIKEA